MRAFLKDKIPKACEYGNNVVFKDIPVSRREMKPLPAAETARYQAKGTRQRREVLNPK